MRTIPLLRISGRPRRWAAAGLLTLALTACNHDDGTIVFTPFNVPNSVAVADVNGDGAPDLLVATTLDQGLTDNPGFANVILNSAATPGTFSTGVSYPTSTTNPSSIAVADLTGAGHPDLVVATVSGGVSVYLHGTTAGTFQSAVNIDSGGAPNQVVIA
ncbi:MAG: VCBS repeat-containing protein, partial [Gammaproteobacteria bacterium]|nr:VCBS repeat-containing protein [Gammaproteobacteria bacterium]